MEPSYLFPWEIKFILYSKEKAEDGWFFCWFQRLHLEVGRWNQFRSTHREPRWFQLGWANMAQIWIQKNWESHQTSTWESKRLKLIWLRLCRIKAYKIGSDHSLDHLRSKWPEPKILMGLQYLFLLACAILESFDLGQTVLNQLKPKGTSLSKFSWVAEGRRELSMMDGLRSVKPWAGGFAHISLFNFNSPVRCV